MAYTDASGQRWRQAEAMIETTLDNGPDTRVQDSELRVQNADLRAQLEQLRAENTRLRAENRELRCSLDAYVRRAASSALFGPLEMSAGTSVGPRRRRTAGDERAVGSPSGCAAAATRFSGRRGS